MIRIPGISSKMENRQRIEEAIEKIISPMEKDKELDMHKLILK